MKKHVAIVGGGISGLAALHYLVGKYGANPDVAISLYEKNLSVGGTIRSIDHDPGLIEAGPNGFLDNHPRTIQFIEELEATSSVIEADPQARIRFISLANALHEIPTSPKKFLSSGLLNISQKLRLFAEPLISKSSDEAISIYDFAKRRFGECVARLFIDPMVAGIYAGDAKQICVKAVFPKMYDFEQREGSVIKGMMKHKPKSPRRLLSFKGGMQQLIDTLHGRYKNHIHVNTPIHQITQNAHQFTLKLENQFVDADELYLCAPAYGASKLVEGFDRELARYLSEIVYAPVAVVGLIFPKDSITIPSGFGYLIPSSEQNAVLGVLFESNIFPGRRRNGEIILRVMMGGVRNPACLEQTNEDLIQLASMELSMTLGVSNDLYKALVIRWPKAIPQYDSVYLSNKSKIEERLIQYPHLHLVANYLNGVSMNDCIENAFEAVQRLNW